MFFYLAKGHKICDFGQCKKFSTVSEMYQVILQFWFQDDVAKMVYINSVVGDRRRRFFFCFQSKISSFFTFVNFRAFHAFLETETDQV